MGWQYSCGVLSFPVLERDVTRARLHHFAMIAACAVAVGCAKAPTDPAGSTNEDGTLTPAVFTASPLRLTDITEIWSIGNLGPPSHVVPTEHAYLVFYKDYTPGAPGPRLPVYAPGSGTVTRWLVTTPNAYRIDVQVNSWLSYYLILFDMDTVKYRAGARVTAGEQIGVTTGHANTLDIGVINRRIRRDGFARLERYGGDTRYIDSPFKYFAEPVKSQLYARVNREGADKDGTIEVDVPGTLAGAWYREDVPVTAAGEITWRAIVFAPDVKKPTQPRVSVGVGFSISGLFGVQDGAPAYATVTPSSGSVGYRLDGLDNSANPWRGVLMVRLAHRDSLDVEFFPGSTNLSQPMTSARTRFVR